ncbi:MAG: hypothetical protein EHM12_11145 [Dehalococcoidia bacterium]|nr:MAG: hypothetical protein EHM12_11145 [Dehalococcoidia bacterium]
MNKYLNLLDGWKRNSGIVIMFIAMVLKQFDIELPEETQKFITDVLTYIGGGLALWGTGADLTKKVTKKRGTK